MGQVHNDGSINAPSIKASELTGNILPVSAKLILCKWIHLTFTVSTRSVDLICATKLYKIDQCLCKYHVHNLKYIIADWWVLGMRMNRLSTF